jgi:hypothetical protein
MHNLASGYPGGMSSLLMLAVQARAVDGLERYHWGASPFGFAAGEVGRAPVYVFLGLDSAPTFSYGGGSCHVTLGTYAMATAGVWGKGAVRWVAHVVHAPGRDGRGPQRGGRRDLRREGAVLATFALPAALQLDDDAWTHLAFNTKEGSVLGKTIVALSIGGYLLEQKAVLTPIDGRPFTMGSGVLRVGAPSGGFDGWVDELRVFEAWLGPVDICGTAYGRLVGDAAADAASPYPASSHAQLTALIADPTRHYPAYRCERHRPDHFDYAAELADKVCIAKGDSDPRCVGDAIVFPEGPVYVDAPRPDATQNGFCARCHTDSSPSFTLSRTVALQAISTPFSLSHDAFDRRRQPRNPPRTVFGHPGSFLEPYGFGTDPRGIEIDDLTFPSLP